SMQARHAESQLTKGSVNSSGGHRPVLPRSRHSASTPRISHDAPGLKAHDWALTLVHFRTATLPLASIPGRLCKGCLLHCKQKVFCDFLASPDVRLTTMEPVTPAIAITNGSAPLIPFSGLAGL